MLQAIFSKAQTATDETSATEQVFVGDGNNTPADTYNYNEQCARGVYGGNSGVHGNMNPECNSGVRGNTNPEYTYLDEEGDSDGGTDSDTISSCGDRERDFQDIAHLAEVAKEQELFWAASHAKSRWRQFMRKSARCAAFSARPSPEPSTKARVMENRKANACPEGASLPTLPTSMMTTMGHVPRQRKRQRQGQLQERTILWQRQRPQDQSTRQARKHHEMSWMPK